MDDAALNIFSRMKSSHGRYPVLSAAMKNDADGHPYLFWEFIDNRVASEKRLRLEDLAGCTDSSGSISSSDAVNRILDYASSSGPLFGCVGQESVADWQVAIYNASLAVTLQETINGTKSLSFAQDRIEKNTIIETDGATPPFTVFYLTLRGKIESSKSYFDVVSKLPWMKEFPGSGVAFDYVFANSFGEGNEELIHLYLVSCQKELSSTVLAAFLCFLNTNQNDTEWLDAVAQGPFAQLYEREAYREAKKLFKKRFHVQRGVVTGSDKAHLQHLVQAIAALHLDHVHLDLFQSGPDSDYLSFDCFLESLWYTFAKSLDVVKVGYCAQCGKGFSTTGHRGMKKEYCSEECRTKAKNARNKEKRDKIRELYLAGATLEECACRQNPAGLRRAAEGSVRESLRKWKRLQHAISEEAQAGSDALAMRCLGDGIFDDKQLSYLRRKRKK